MAHGNNTNPIPGELRSVATDGVVASADAIKDYKKGKFQEQVNKEVDTEIANIKGGSTDSIASLKTAINNEKSRAQSAESGLQNSINTEKSRAEGAESNLQNAVNAEKSRAQGAESTLQNNINAEKARAEGVEATKANAADVYTKAQGTAFEGEVNNTISQQNTNIANKFAQQDAAINSKFNQQDQVIDERLDAQDEKIDTLEKQDVEVVEDHEAVENPDPKKIYREPSEDKTSYTDWMYQDGWIELATYSFPGIDDEPTEDSPNVVKSGGLAAYYGSYKESPEFIKVELDEEDKVLEGMRNDGTKVIGGDLLVNGDAKVIGDTEIGGVSYKVVENPEWVRVVVDSEDKVLCGIKQNGKFYADLDGVDKQVKELIQPLMDEIEELVDRFDEIFKLVDNPEYMSVEFDSDEKVLGGRKTDGTKFENVGLDLGGAILKSTNDPEGRMEVKTDSDEKIISYRKPDGTLVENAGIETNHLELTEQGMTDFQQALKDAGFNPGGGGDYSDTITNKGKKPVYIPMPRLARVNIIWDGNLSSLSKADQGGTQKVNYDVKVPVEFFDGQGVYFRKYALMSAQGNSSMAFEKKNISLKFFDTEDVEGNKHKWGKGDTFGTVFGDWVMQKTYHLKAFHTDFIRGSSEVAYQLADEVYKTRGIYEDRPWKKALIDFSEITSVTPANLSKDGMKDMALRIDNGARCMPDGFPVIVYQNGEFYGIYVWMLKQDADNFNMDTSEVKHIHLDGELYVQNLWDGTINWTAFEIRNPEDLVCMDGSDYDGDFPKELIDETSEHYDSTDENHVRSVQVKKYIIDLSNRVGEINRLNTTDSAAAKVLFDTYFDADNLIDYQLINMACGDTDGFGKNWQWATWDGVKWYVNQYDKDMSFGNYWTGMFTTPPITGWIKSDENLPVGIAIRYYLAEHKTRWQQLVSAGIFTADHIKSLITDWVKRIGQANYENEWKKWPEAPCNRNSMIDYENWRFKEGIRPPYIPSGVWNSETEYAEGDNVWFPAFDNGWYLGFTAVKSNTNKPPLKGSYTKYPMSMGYRDSAWRFYKYIDETIQNQNIFINSLNV